MSRPAVLARVVGMVGLVHVGLGLVAGPFGMWMAWRLSPAVLEQPEVRRAIEDELRNMPEAGRDAAGHLDMAELRQVLASPRFRLVVSAMASLGIAFNLGIGYSCWRLFRGATEALRAFLLLMVGLLLYAYVLPWAAVPGSSVGATFAAAWGVGNMGLAPFLFSRYWLWGTILLVAGTRWRRPERQARESDAAEQGDEADEARGGTRSAS